MKWLSKLLGREPSAITGKATERLTTQKDIPPNTGDAKQVSDALSTFMKESEDNAKLEQVNVLKEMGQKSLGPLLHEAFDEYGDPNTEDIDIARIRVALWCGCAIHPQEFDRFYRTKYRNGRTKMLDEMRAINMKDGMSGQTYVHELLARSTVSTAPNGAQAAKILPLPQKTSPATLLPPELISPERHLDVHTVLRGLTTERLAEVCAALPIEQLDLEKPDNSPQMKDAVLTVFPVANYVLTNKMPSGVVDSVISRLVKRIEEVGPSRLHPQLADPDVWNVAVGMGKYGREQDSLRCLNVLAQMVTKYAKPVCVMKYMILHNIAYDSNKRQDIDRALTAGKEIPEGQMQPSIRAAMQSLTDRRNSAKE